nr:ABC transporter ATP-binding protein [uncultured Limnohabitans sp.]
MSIDASLGGLAARLWLAIGQARRRQFRLLLALMVLSSLAEVVTVGAVLPFLSALANPQLLLEHTALRPTFERLGVSTPADVTLATTLAFCAAVVLAGVVRILVLRLSLGYAFGLGADISNDVYRRSLHQPYAVHIARNSSEVINGIAIKTSEVIFYVIAPAMTLFSSAFMVVAILLTLAAIIPASALAAFGVFGVLYALMMRTLRHGLRANSDRIAHESTNTIRYLQEGLGGIRDILLDRTQDTFVATFQRSDGALRKAQCENQFVSQSPRFLMESTGMVLIALIALGFSRGGAGVAGVVPTLAALALGLQRLLPALQQLYQSWSSIQGSQGSLRETVKLLEQPLAPASERTASPLRFDDRIELREVGFRYAAGAPAILNDFNLVIRKGTRIGFVGETGSGKSTLLDIVMGLLHPSDGRMLVDGVPVTPANVDAWRPHIAHVPQDLFLKDGTVRENIAFGVPAEAIDDDEVRRAAAQAQIGSTIEGWAYGYETLVGERGVQLSGGQRQRIGIARALYKKADVIIFDEATSALDNATEEAVMRSIEGLDERITVLIIAHRLSTLRNCDEIVELHRQATADAAVPTT